MQALTRFVEYNYELLVHRIVHSLGEVYKWSHQIHTQGIYKVCHLPVQGVFKNLVYYNKLNWQLKICIANDMALATPIYGNVQLGYSKYQKQVSSHKFLRLGNHHRKILFKTSSLEWASFKAWTVSRFQNHKIQ